MVNYCAVCARVFNDNLMPLENIISNEIFMAGTCKKCKDEKYNPELLDILDVEPWDFKEHQRKFHQFNIDRINRYGS